MEQNKVNTFAAKFKKAFSEAVLNELGKATRYCHRVRAVYPQSNGDDADGLVCGSGGSWPICNGGSTHSLAMPWTTSPSTTSSPSGSLPRSCARRHDGCWRPW